LIRLTNSHLGYLGGGSRDQVGPRPRGRQQRQNQCRTSPRTAAQNPPPHAPPATPPPCAGRDPREPEAPPKIWGRRLGALPRRRGAGRGLNESASNFLRACGRLYMAHCTLATRSAGRKSGYTMFSLGAKVTADARNSPQSLRIDPAFPHLPQ
jgi:hypothetical protein